jgi:hypothetical protein
MGSMLKVVKQLKQEHARLTDELHKVSAALTAFVGVYRGVKPARKKRTMSAKARARISAAQKARWKTWRAKQKKAA